MIWGDDLVAQKRSRDYALARMIRNQQNREAMLAGPRLAEDGHTLIIPSHVFNEQAKDFWKSKGFRFDGDTNWTRDTRCPLDGKHYPPSVWLERTRAKFYEFYPQYYQPESAPGGSQSAA
ncbi:MAG: hypothetical protein JW934_16420 [Anaerolineae bacterium]|nr:hypothetical protein [Anaerolineae bacterium]